MKHISKFIICAAVALTAASCTPKPYISCEITSIEVQGDGSSRTVDFTTNNAWSATSSDSWIVLHNDSGQGGHTSFSLYVLPNDTFDERQGSITISSAGEVAVIDILQKQNNSLEISQWHKTVGYEGEELRIEVEANVEWTVNVTSGADWVSVVDTKALSKTEKIISVAANEGAQERSACVAFSSPDHESRYLSIVQRGKVPTVVIVHNLDEFEAPTVSFAENAPTIEWGDGSRETYSAGISHTYALKGEHTVTISGQGMSICTLNGIAGLLEFSQYNF